MIDTHAALWLVDGDARLSPTARSRIERSNRSELLVSDLLLLELSMLIWKGQVTIAGSRQSFLERLANCFTVAPINPNIADQAMSLPLPQGDPFDRVFVATAIQHDAALVTRDAIIRDAALVATVW